jgi:hypothetical protein
MNSDHDHDHDHDLWHKQTKNRIKRQLERRFDVPFEEFIMDSSLEVLAQFLNAEVFTDRVYKPTEHEITWLIDVLADFTEYLLNEGCMHVGDILPRPRKSSGPPEPPT